MRPALRTEIAKLREASGLQQKEVAAICGVSTNHYQAVELGTRRSQVIERKVKTALRK